MRKPHHLSNEFWSRLSDGQQALYAAVRPMPKAAQALDCRLAEVENFIEWNAQGVKDLGGELELEPDFQRGHVWTDAQRSAYIESLMRKAAPVALSFNCPGWCDPSTGEGDIPDNLMQCIDGLQRLTAVRKYVAGQLRVFGGRTVEDFKGSPFDPARYSLKFLIFQFEHRVDLLQFYLDINNGGSRHEESELERVRNLLRAAQCHEAAPFALEGQPIPLEPGRVEGIVSDLLADDQQTFVCHKTLDKERMTCAGAVGLMSKLGRLPVIARMGLAYGVITEDDIAASAAMVIEPSGLSLPSAGAAN